MVKTLKKSKDSYRHGSLKKAIIEASLQMIEKEGVDTLSIREVAKKAGVTHQAPYRHFKNREALLAALAQDGLEKLFSYLQQSFRTEGAPSLNLVKLGQAYFSWGLKNPDHFRLMFGHSIPDFETSEELGLAAQKILDLVNFVVIQNQKAKLFRPGEPRSISRQLWAAVHGTTLLFINQQFKPLLNDSRAGLELVKELLNNLAIGLK